MATGDHVFFVDNDDWLERDALERLHATAVQDRADIVIGKVVGHGKGVPLRIFRVQPARASRSTPTCCSACSPRTSCSGAGCSTSTACASRRAGAGSRTTCSSSRAYFAAERISVLADRPVYHWMRREDQDNASYQRFDAAGYYDNVREVLDLVESRTEPGPFRDQLLLHWYRGKMLGRVGGRDWLWRDADFRRELYDAIRPLALERFGEDVHERLPFNLRLRSKLLRRGDFDALGRLSRFERRLEPVVRVRGIERGGTHVVLRLESWFGVGEDQAALRAQGRAHVLAAADGSAPAGRPARPTARSRASCAARTPRCSCATPRTAPSTCCPRGPARP